MATQVTSVKTGSGKIAAWEDDPQSLIDARPIARPRPQLAGLRMRIAIEGAAPPAQVYRPGTQAFRYWTAADALARASAYWADLLPDTAAWHPGGVLPVSLDEGLDLNAYYDRERLCFFHATVRGVPVYSGESPDVLTHELGHALLDVVRPELWDAASIEAAAFHESFGDISAMLSALQLASVRTAVLADTEDHLYRSSRISRLAEQLGWAIRQFRPDAVDADCLRNAVNSFFYQAPEMLPPMAPASGLSSEPHSFSRVFTSAWLESLAGMLATTGSKPTADGLGLLTVDAGRVLLWAISRARIASNYFAQIAAQMILADARLFNGRYGAALKAAFLRHGILAITSVSAVSARAEATITAAAAQPTRRGSAADGDTDRALRRMPSLLRLSLPASDFGVRGKWLIVRTSARAGRETVNAAAPDMGSLPAVSSGAAARAFLEDLFRRGRVELGTHRREAAPKRTPHRRTTHILVRRGRDLELRRRLFDCGFDTA
jgi:hypothetical protein